MLSPVYSSEAHIEHMCSDIELKDENFQLQGVAANVILQLDTHLDTECIQKIFHL